MNNPRYGRVYVQSSFAGLIEETDEGFRFTYDTDYLSQSGALAVSLSMPLQATPFFEKNLFPFFDGLIPEGWLLERAIDQWKINSFDRFGLLLKLCRDCIGDVSVNEGETE